MPLLALAQDPLAQLPASVPQLPPLRVVPLLAWPAEAVAVATGQEAVVLVPPAAALALSSEEIRMDPCDRLGHLSYQAHPE